MDPSSSHFPHMLYNFLLWTHLQLKPQAPRDGCNVPVEGFCICLCWTLGLSYAVLFNVPKRVHKGVTMYPGHPYTADIPGSSLPRRPPYCTCDLSTSMPRPWAHGRIFLVTFSEVGQLFLPPRFMWRAKGVSPVPWPRCRYQNSIHQTGPWGHLFRDLLG